MNDAHYAVVVGIERYPFIRDLSGPWNDACRFASWLTDAAGGGLPAANVTLVNATLRGQELADPMDVLPTTQEINRALGVANREIKRRTEQDPEVFDRSRLYLFVAGHGIAPTGGKAALLAADASPEEMGYNLEISAYADWYEKNSLFREAVFLADCCRNRVNGAPASGPPFTMKAATEERVDVLVAFATSVDTWAYETAGLDEDPSLIRGYFSTALIEGLQGAAVDEDAGRVTGYLLGRYIGRFVEEQSRKDRRVVPQTVDIKVPVTSMMMFGPDGMKARPIRAVRVRRPPGFAGDIRILDHALEPVSLLPGGTDEREVRLADGFYQAVPEQPGPAPEFANEGRFAVQGGGELVVQL